MSILLCQKVSELANDGVLPDSIRIKCAHCGESIWAALGSLIDSGDERIALCLDCGVADILGSSPGSFDFRFANEQHNAIHSAIQRARKRKKQHGKH